MVTKRQSFWIGVTLFLAFYFALHMILGDELMKNFLSLLGAWQLGAIGQYVWEWVSEKYIKKS